MAGKGKGRSAVEKAQDRRKIADLYLNQKLTQAEIAERLKLGQATISREITAITKEIDGDRRELVERWRERAIAKWSWIQEQAEEAWYRSQRIIVTAKGTIVQVPLVPNDDPDAEKVEKFLLPGDRGFLSEISDAEMKMLKAMGGDKITIGTENDQEVSIQITVAPVAPRVKPGTGGDGQTEPT